MDRTTKPLMWKLQRAALALVLLASAVTLTSGSAAAHECATYDGCDANACKDGENHDHTDYNWWPKEHEHCKSTSRDPKDPPPCVVGPIEVPPIVCRLSGLALPEPGTPADDCVSFASGSGALRQDGSPEILNFRVPDRPGGGC